MFKFTSLFLLFPSNWLGYLGSFSLPMGHIYFLLLFFLTTFVLECLLFHISLFCVKSGSLPSVIIFIGSEMFNFLTF